MEILFDGVTVIFLGKSGVHATIHIHPFVFAILLFGLVGWYAHRRNAHKEQSGEHTASGIDTLFLGLTVVAFLAIALIPIIRATCGNPATCSWHPRADDPATWTVSPDRVVDEAFEAILQ